MSDCYKLSDDIPPEVEGLLDSESRLPSLPSVVVNLIEASKNPEIGLADVSEIIRVDPALSARLLRIANSSMYARRRQITNLREALSILGLNAALNIALSFSLIKTFSDANNSEIDFDHFWQRSIMSATIARQISLQLNMPRPEDYFLASLLQDIGILALDCSSLNFLATDSELDHAKRIEYEKNIMGVDHSAIGSWLLKSWGLPEKLYLAVLCSHNVYAGPLDASEDRVFYQCVGLSGSLAEIWVQSKSKQAVEDNYKLCRGILGFDREEFNEFICEITELIPEMSSLFEMTLVDDKQRERIINEARDILMERNLGIIKKFDEYQQQVESLAERTRDIEDEARRDHLTGIYNRKHMEKLLADEYTLSSQESVPLTVAFIDIDDFKSVNDCHGHFTGDEVLKTVAGFFTSHLRKTDILARYGGDEFILMLPNTSASPANMLLNRLMNKLKDNPITTNDGSSVTILMSIGVATHMDRYRFEDVRELINAADKSLYLAKQGGKHKVVSYEQ